jgi:hypothetical protein
MNTAHRTLITMFVAILSAGCSAGVVVPAAKKPAGKVIVVDETPRARVAHVPPGHYPAPGHCRLWYAGRPPGRQPKAVPCMALRGHVVLGNGIFIVHNSRSWDADYDWRGWEKRHPGSVPPVVLTLLGSARKSN